LNQVQLFLESCRSEETKKQYSIYLKKYFEFAGEKSLEFESRKAIEDKLIEYIIFLKKQGKTRAAIHNYVAPVGSFYAIHDVTLNMRKIGKFIPENHKIKNDRAYTHQEISKLLEIADERARAITLLLASSGVRKGAVPSLKLRNLQGVKLVVYEGANEEYFTFITPECKQAIDSYIEMRSRYGEKLNDDSFLIREQFDIRNPGKPKQIDKSAVHWKLYDLCNRCGIDKKNIAVAHGFRKFFTTQLVSSRVNPEIREMLLGHKIGLASAYYRPTEEEMYQEYTKAVNNLTINVENRLKMKIEKLEVEKTNFDALASEIAEIKKKIKLH
jgi:integrase